MFLNDFLNIFDVKNSPVCVEKPTLVFFVYQEKRKIENISIIDSLSESKSVFTKFSRFLAFIRFLKFEQRDRHKPNMILER